MSGKCAQIATFSFLRDMSEEASHVGNVAILTIVLQRHTLSQTLPTDYFIFFIEIAHFLH